LMIILQRCVDCRWTVELRNVLYCSVSDVVECCFVWFLVGRRCQWNRQKSYRRCSVWFVGPLDNWRAACL